MRVKISQGMVPAASAWSKADDGFAALRAENDNFVAGLDAGNLRDIEHNLIHADAAHKRRALAANQES